LDGSVNKQGEAALKRLSDVHDIHVPLCPALLAEFNDAKYKYRQEITRQYMLASGVFQIENPLKLEMGMRRTSPPWEASSRCIAPFSSRSRTRSGSHWMSC